MDRDISTTPLKDRQMDVEYMTPNMSTPGSASGYRRYSEGSSVGGSGSSSTLKHSSRSNTDRSRRESDREKGVVSNEINTYKLANEIGRGAYAVVYEAMNIETGVSVALKRFPLAAVDVNTLESIEAEIELMQTLDHPNIVKYIDRIRTRSHLYIALEYMENGSLANLLKKFGSFSESLVISYATQILHGLKYLHEQGVLHRDIKGANILTNKDGRVKLADFGVALKVSKSHTEELDVIGTPYWMAPEIIEMSSTQTAACDVWSLGCTIVELLTGKPPYFDLAPMAALYRIVKDDYPPLPSGISSALCDFLLRCFQKEPAMRSTVVKLLEHPWLHKMNNPKGGSSQTSSNSSGNINAGTSSSPRLRGLDRSSDIEKDGFCISENGKPKSQGTSKSPRRHFPALTESDDADADAANFLFRGSKKEGAKVRGTSAQSSSPSSKSIPASPPSSTLPATSLISSVSNTPKTPGLPSVSSSFPSGTAPVSHQPATFTSMFSPEPKFTGSSDSKRTDNRTSPRFLDNRQVVTPDKNQSLLGGPDEYSRNNDISERPLTQHIDTTINAKATMVSGHKSELNNQMEGSSSHLLSRHESTSKPNDSTKTQETADFNQDNSCNNALKEEAANQKASRTKFHKEIVDATDPQTSPSQVSRRSSENVNKIMSQFPPTLHKHRISGTLLDNTGDQRLSNDNLTAYKSPYLKENEMDERRARNAATESFYAQKLNKYHEDMEENPIDGLDFSDVMVSDQIENIFSPTSATTGTPDPSPASMYNEGRLRQRAFSEPLCQAYLGGPDATAYQEDSRVSRNASNDTEDSKGSESLESGSVDELLGKLLSRLKTTLDDNVAAENIDDSFLMHQFEEQDFKEKQSDDESAIRLKDMVCLMNKIQPDTSELDVETACKLLIDMLDNYGCNQIDELITYHGIMPIVEMFEARWNKSAGLDTLPSRRPYMPGMAFILRVINKIIEYSVPARKQLCESGIIPSIFHILESGCKSIKDAAAVANATPAPSVSPRAWPFALSPVSPSATPANPFKKIDTTIIEAGKCIHKIASTPQLAMVLQATGGLPILVQMVSFISLLPLPSIGNDKADKVTTQSMSNSDPRLTLSSFSASSSFAMEEDSREREQIQPVSPSPHSTTTTPPQFHPVSSEEAQQLLVVVFIGVDCIIQLLLAQSSRTRNYCRTCVRLGLLPHLSTAFQIIISQLHSSGQFSPSTLSSDASQDDWKSILDSIVSDPGETQSKEVKYALNIATIFDIFSRSDAVVADQMTKEGGVLLNILSVLRAPMLSNTTFIDSSLLRQYYLQQNQPQHQQQQTHTSPLNLSSFLEGMPPTHALSPHSSSKLSMLTSTSASFSLHNSVDSRASSFTQFLSDDYIKIVELLLKCLRNLSMEPSTLLDLEKAGTINTLMPLLNSKLSSFKTYIIPTLFNLCRINKRRQEQAALQGIIPHLQKIIIEKSHMRQFALPIMFDMAHASAATRIELWKHNGIPFYINLLKENYWGLFALNSLAVWLANDTEHVQSLLIDPPNLTRLVNFFRSTSHQTIEVHKPLLDMMIKSEGLCRHLSSSGLFVSCLVRKLQQAEPIVLILLLKMMQLLHANHINPRQLVLDNNLYNVVRSLAKTEEQVLVHQMANRLLKDFQSSTLS